MADFHVVSERREREIKAHQAFSDAVCALSGMACDLLRLIAGGGRGYELEQWSGRFLDAAEKYRAVAGHGLLADEIRNELSAAMPVKSGNKESESPYDLEHDTPEITRSVLRIVAARLDGNSTQESRNESALADALRARDARIKEFGPAYLRRVRGNGWRQHG